MMALWGLAVLFSWTGLGTLVARIARLQRGVRIDWGLRTAWGMSLTLAIGGVLMVFHLANLLALQALVLVGLVLWGYDFYLVLKGPRELRLRAGRRWRRRFPWLIPLLILGALVYLGNIITLENSWWDDIPAYLVFIKKFLATGTVIEPFSWRRLATYAGQELLQAQIQSQGNELNINLVDQALSMLMILGLLVGMFRGHGLRHLLMMMLVGLLALAVEVPRANSQSHLSGVVLFLALFRTLQLHRLGDRRCAGAAVIAGMVAAAVSTFRMNFVPAAALVLLLAFAGAAHFDQKRWRLYARDALLAIATFIVLLVPWAIALYQSSRSLFYPLMHGNQRPEYNDVLSAPLSPGAAIRWIAGFLVYWKVALVVAPFFLLLTPPFRRHWRAALPLAVASLLGAVAVARAFSSANYINLYRYSFPMLFPACLVALALAGRSGRRPLAWGTSLVLLGTLLAVNLPDAVRHQARLIRMTVLPQTTLFSFSPPPLLDEYRGIQALVPEGAKIYSIVNVPTNFDFSRNTIYTADQAGIASPDPGIPIAEGRDAILHYFQGLGIDYIVAAHFDTALALYQRPRYREISEHPDQHPEVERPDKIVAGVSVKLEDALDTLATPDRLLASGPSIRLIYVGRLPLPGRPPAAAGPGPSPPPP
jgi:hypothetical protein